MKKAVIVSDTHGNLAALDALDGIFSECDLIFHLGDTSRDGAYIRGKYPDKTYVINGNCDFAALGENEVIVEVEKVRIFACHGHTYSVKHTLSKLADRAKELGCSVALYGHTHRAEEREVGGVLTINPGNMSRYSQNSYCYLVINGDRATSKIVYPDKRNL